MPAPGIVARKPPVWGLLKAGLENQGAGRI